MYFLLRLALVLGSFSHTRWSMDIDAFFIFDVFCIIMIVDK